MDQPYPQQPPQPVAPPATPPMPALPPVMPAMPVDPAAALNVGVPLSAEPAIPAPAPAPAPAPTPTPTPALAPASTAASFVSLGNALVLVMIALAWQLVSYYAREQLPALEASGAALTNFDRVVGAMPLVGSSIGPFIGALFAIGGLAMLWVGLRRSERDPVLQGVIAALALLSLALTMLLPALAG